MKTREWKKLYGHTISFVCPYCLKTVPLSEATKDHVTPKSRGGKTEPSNIILTCKKCNHEKGALDEKEYTEWKRLEFIRNGGLSRKDYCR